MGRNLPIPLGVALVLALLPAGCGKGSSKLTRVQGTVFYHGVPMEGGTIVFIPDAERGGSGPIGHAEIRPGGVYTLQTDEEAGLASGWHRVTIAGTASIALPPRFADPELSGLEREVKPDSVNIIDIRLD